MGKVNICLKRIFSFVSSLIAIIAFLMLALTIFVNVTLDDQDEMDDILPILIVMYIFSIITLVLVTMGLVGASKERQWALILFTVGMILSSLSIIALFIHGRIMQPQLVEEVERQYLDKLPLTNASRGFLAELVDTQMNYHCCGVDRGYLDWGYKISESCVCTGESAGPCVAAPRNSSLFEHTAGGETIMVYNMTCLQNLVDIHLFASNVALGINFGVILLWLLAVALCIFILRQLHRKTDTHTVVYSQVAKGGNYTIFTDAEKHH